ncbi:hypothetical protein BMAJHU_I1315 [Burkholderia mallei JHU]|nr:hypothetical protein BMASAVP1_1088 [Burkholderia mallei SAVP1]EDK62108.1 hypothetical protein BMAJHU_I1315 [Burkholderia mallei JHU]EEC32872.1 hypothetical protein BUC_7451 [Burkholderia pseudomallei 576]
MPSFHSGTSCCRDAAARPDAGRACGAPPCPASARVGGV